MKNDLDASPKSIHTIDKCFDAFMKSTYKNDFPHLIPPVKLFFMGVFCMLKKQNITTGHIVGNFTRLTYKVLPNTVIEPFVVISNSGIFGGSIGPAIKVPAGHLWN